MVGRWKRGSKDRYATIAPPISGPEGQGVAAPISWRVRTHTRGAYLRTAHPKVRTQKKSLTLGERCASAPRIHLKPGWNRGPGGHREGRGAVRSDLHRSPEHNENMP